MKSVVYGYIIAPIVFIGCALKPESANTQMADWTEAQLERYRFHSRCATHEVYRQEITLPLGAFYWKNKEFRDHLKSEYGIDTVNATEW